MWLTYVQECGKYIHTEKWMLRCIKQKMACMDLKLSVYMLKMSVLMTFHIAFNVLICQVTYYDVFIFLLPGPGLCTHDVSH